MFKPQPPYTDGGRYCDVPGFVAADQTMTSAAAPLVVSDPSRCYSLVYESVPNT
jgi:hypothetical protein